MVAEAVPTIHRSCPAPGHCRSPRGGAEVRLREYQRNAACLRPIAGSGDRCADRCRSGTGSGDGSRAFCAASGGADVSLGGVSAPMTVEPAETPDAIWRTVDMAWRPADVVRGVPIRVFVYHSRTAGCVPAGTQVGARHAVPHTALPKLRADV